MEDYISDSASSSKNRQVKCKQMLIEFISTACSYMLALNTMTQQRKSPLT